MKKFIVLILDGFGVGYMDDVLEIRKRDYGANTARHIFENIKNLKLSNLEKLGLMNILDFETETMKKSPVGIYGKSKLQHYGGDTFLGHQEIMGTKTEIPLIKPFSFYIDKVENILKENGYSVERRGDKVNYLWVNDSVAIGDNLETDLGQVYNVTTSFNSISFEDELKIGFLVRSVVDVERVIVFGGENATKESILEAEQEIDGKYIGINAPLSKVYEKGYMVRHLGYGIDPLKQIPHKLSNKGINVTLIGKVADIVFNDRGESYMNLVDTKTILNLTIEKLKDYSGFICINVQETDLSGHAQDVKKYSEILKIADRYIGEIINMLDEEDILIVSADHGNDPCIGHSQHTRENVPLMIYNKKIFNEKKIIDLGIRDTMSDTAATALDFFGLNIDIEQGKSYLEKIK